MTQFCKFLLAFGIPALLIAPAFADDAPKPKRAQAQAAKAAAKAGARKKEQPVVQLPRDITLSEEQKTKVAEIEKEFAPKLKELNEKLDKVLTEDQKKARTEAMHKVRTDGKRGREALQAVKDATKATDEQQKQLDETEKQILELRHKAREKVLPILTEDQKSKLPKRAAANPTRKAKAAKTAKAA